MPPTTQNKSHTVFVIYLLSFLFTLHSALPIYINSTFLSAFTKEEFIGILYTISSLLTIGAFVFMPRVLSRFGNYKITLLIFIIELIALFGLASGTTLSILAPAFIISFIAIALLGFNLDVFMESFSAVSTTGKIRGFFLTSSNIAWVVAPLITSFILTNGDYWKIYLAAGILIVPILFLLQSNLGKFKDVAYVKTPFFSTLKEIWHDKNIFGILMASFLLQFFYAWMIIYTPLYLHQHIGFGWDELGIIFSFMLLPFVLTEIPLGKLADTRLGEKEILAIGFLIMALATALVSFIHGNNIILWAVLLFITRIGASMVEIMTETYFFKKIDSSKVHILSMFRTTRPWAYVISPLVATVLFMFVEFKYIFLVLGLLMFVGLRYSLVLDDTK